LIAQLSFAFSVFEGSAHFLARCDQTDVGVSSGLMLALAFSVVPMLLPLTRLAVGLPVRETGGLTAFPCSTIVTG
jgi:hypothetical protein